MSTESELDYRVVRNHEEQYSVWPADREPPAGWRAQGFVGSRQNCLDHIGTVWTDMRPLSLRGAASGASAGADTRASSQEPAR